MNGMTGRPLRRASLVVLSFAFAAAGALHLSHPAPFLLITPDWVPHPEQVVRATGAAELLGAAGLLFPRTRKAAAAALALYAVAVFPANVKHAVEGVAVPGLPDSWWYHGPRLAFQPVIVLWALWVGGWFDRAASRRLDGTRSDA